jgi:hypothetical protein
VIDLVPLPACVPVFRHQVLFPLSKVCRLETERFELWLVVLPTFLERSFLPLYVLSTE